jgi:uncharacterized protein (TIGR02588 family)
MSKSKKAAGVAPRTQAEWVSLIVSLLLLAGVVGLVVALWISPSGRPARFRVERGPARSEAGRYYLPVTVVNDGDATGAQVTVEGRLAVGGGEETATTTFDFIPARSSAEGVLVFTGDPSAAAVSVVSFQKP